MKGLRIAAVGLALVAAPGLAGNKLISTGRPRAGGPIGLLGTPHGPCVTTCGWSLWQ